LTRLLKAERAARVKLRTARETVDAALKAAREETGISYGQLAKVTGLTAETVRSRITQPHVTAREARQAELGRLMKAKPSVSAAEAARRLKTSRTQIAVLVGDGRLHEIEYEGRARKRIALDAAWHAAVEAKGLHDTGAVEVQVPGRDRRRVALDAARRTAGEGPGRQADAGDT
ncbi:MAG TPA: hypothetical protein VFE45_12890, partial [Coriobacteriia bacterium]|nr:hypothetical protein [Coriobacteriia bacterium]